MRNLLTVGLRGLRGVDGGTTAPAAKRAAGLQARFALLVVLACAGVLVLGRARRKRCCSTLSRSVPPVRLEGTSTPLREWPSTRALVMCTSSTRGTSALRSSRQT